MYKATRRNVPIKKVKKEGSKVIFVFEDDKTFTYDLATKKYYGLSGREVQRPSSQFSGLKITEAGCRSKFEDTGFYDFLKKVSSATGRFNIAGVLDAASDDEFKNLESYARVGINVDSSVRVPLSEIPKPMRVWFAAQPHTQIQTHHIDKWKHNAQLMESIMSFYNDDTKEACNAVVFQILNEYPRYRYTEEERNRYDAYHLSQFRSLVQESGYDVGALINYINNICRYEGIMYNSVIRTLYDYVRMQKGVGATSFEKYPRCLLTTHNIAVRNYDRMRIVHDESAFAATYDERYDWSYQGMKFICPQKAADIKNEAVQQQHCVAAYIDDVIAGRTRILFMRDNDEPDKSLITLEYKNGRIVQARGHLNRMPTPREKRFIEIYERHLETALAEEAQSA